MASSADTANGRSEPDRPELADVSALADETLAPERRTEVRARIAASSELTALYERERRVVDLLHGARDSVRAPQALRARIERERQSRAHRARPSTAYRAVLAGALAAAVLALVLTLPGGSPGAPSVSQAAALAPRGASSPAPAPDPSNPGVKLARDVENIYFPNWTRRFGWRATGQRADTVGGQRAITVYYDWRGRQLAYTIVSAPALAEPRASVSALHGTELRTFALDGRRVVTWRRSGHTCVLSAHGVDAAILQRLAAWSAPGLGRG